MADRRLTLLLKQLSDTAAVLRVLQQMLDIAATLAPDLDLKDRIEDDAGTLEVFSRSLEQLVARLRSRQ